MSTSKKYWRLTLPASVKGNSGELKGSTTAVLKLKSYNHERGVLIQ